MVANVPSFLLAIGVVRTTGPPVSWSLGHMAACLDIGCISIRGWCHIVLVAPPRRGVAFRPHRSPFACCCSGPVFFLVERGCSHRWSRVRLFVHLGGTGSKVIGVLRGFPARLSPEHHNRDRSGELGACSCLVCLLFVFLWMPRVAAIGDGVCARSPCSPCVSYSEVLYRCGGRGQLFFRRR